MMNRMSLGFWPLLLLILLVGGCGSRETTSTVSETERTEARGSAERRLAELGARIDSLTIRIHESGDSAKADLNRELEELRARRDAARVRVDTLQVAAGERWEAAKQEMAEALDSLGAGIDRLKDRLSGGGARPRS